jgi:hypothetical protein
MNYQVIIYDCILKKTINKHTLYNATEEQAQELLKWDVNSARANLNRSYSLLTNAMGLNGYPQASSPSSGFSFTSPEQAQAAINARVAELQGQVSSQQQAYIDQYNTKAKSSFTTGCDFNNQTQIDFFTAGY